MCLLKAPEPRGGTLRNDPFLTRPKTLPNGGADTMGRTMGGTMGACNGWGFPVGFLDPGVQCNCPCRRTAENAISWVWPDFQLLGMECGKKTCQ